MITHPGSIPYLETTLQGKLKQVILLISELVDCPLATGLDTLQRTETSFPSTRI